MQVALYADIGQRIGNAIVGALAVAGAAAVGYGLTFGLLWLVGKLAFGKQLPTQIKRFVSVVGGVATALLIGWLLFFGPGGGGLGGGGFGFGFGSGKGSGDGVAPQRTQPDRPEGSSRTNAQGGEGTAAPLQILMLGGEQVKGVGENELTYYQVQPDAKAYGFNDLKALVRERKGGKPPLREIVIIIRSDSVAHNHPAVKRLEDFAKDERLAISYQKPD